MSASSSESESWLSFLIFFAALPAGVDELSSPSLFFLPVSSKCSPINWRSSSSLEASWILAAVLIAVLR